MSLGLETVIVLGHKASWQLVIKSRSVLAATGQKVKVLHGQTVIALRQSSLFYWHLVLLPLYLPFLALFPFVLCPLCLVSQGSVTSPYSFTVIVLSV